MPGSNYRYSATFDTTYSEDLLESGPINGAAALPPTNGGPLQALIEADCKLHLSPPHGSESSFSGSSAGSPRHVRSSSVDSLDSSCGSSITRSDAGNTENIPTRRPPKTVCKPAHNPLQFVKINSSLSKEAQEQMKLVNEIKKAKEPLFEEDWQSNLENWKSRRKKSSDHLVTNRLPELQPVEEPKAQRKIKTFSEMLENRPRRPLCNLAIYTDGEEEDKAAATSTPTSHHVSPPPPHQHNSQEEKSPPAAADNLKEDKLADSGLDSLSSSHRTLAVDSDSSLEANCTTDTELLREFSSCKPPLPRKVGSEEDEGLELYLHVSLQPEASQDFTVRQLVVDSLAPGGASEQAGLRIGDHILALNGEEAGHSLSSLLEQAFNLGQLELLVWRHTITNNLTRQWHQNQTNNILDTSEEHLLQGRQQAPVLSQEEPPIIRAANFKEKVKSFEMLSATQEDRKPPVVPHKSRATNRHRADTPVSRSQSLDNCYLAERPVEEVTNSCNAAEPNLEEDYCYGASPQKEEEDLNIIYQSCHNHVSPPSQRATDFYNIPVALDHLVPPRLAVEPPKQPPPPPPSAGGKETAAPPLSPKSPSSSTKKIKKELRKRRTDFLGIDSFQEESPSREVVKPPPTMEELLRKERDTLRELKQHSSSSPPSTSQDVEERLRQSENKIRHLKAERRRVQLQRSTPQSQWDLHPAPPSLDPEDYGRLHDQLSLWQREEALRLQEESLRRERERLHREQEALRREQQLYQQLAAQAVPPPTTLKPSPPAKPERVKQAAHARSSSQPRMAPQHHTSRPSWPSGPPARQVIPPPIKKRSPKGEGGRLNTNHWLIQEAEHRRLAERAKWPPTALAKSLPSDLDKPPADKKLSVSGKKKCSSCDKELGKGAAMIIQSLNLYYHVACFQCCVCRTQLGNGERGADVRVRANKIHCHACFSNDEEGLQFTQV